MINISNALKGQNDKAWGLYPSQNLFSEKIQKQFCPSKVLGAFCPGITATKIWFFEKPKTKPVLV